MVDSLEKGGEGAVDEWILTFARFEILKIMTTIVEARHECGTNLHSCAPPSFHIHYSFIH